MSGPYFIGVDVGTGSARAGVFDAAGTMLGSAKHDIALYQAAGDIAEQSSEDIWQAVCGQRACGRRPERRRSGGRSRASVSTRPVRWSWSTPRARRCRWATAPERNIIVWMDHRATEQATRINATGHPVLAYVGGVISPEMETPKLLWLKENKPQTYDAAWQFFDLADYLTWRATGSLARSVCTVTCKWTYLAHEAALGPELFSKPSASAIWPTKGLPASAPRWSPAARLWATG